MSFKVKGATLKQIRKLFRKAKAILHQQGFAPFLKSVASFFLRLIFSYSKRYLYEHSLADCDDIPIIPCKIPNVVVRPMYIPTMTIFDYEQRGEEVFEFPSHPDAQSYEGGNRGTIVFYATAGGEFVHRSAVTFREKGTDYERVYRKISGTPSFSLSSLHDDKTVYEAFSVTNPKYRGRGLYAHVFSVEHRFLKERGFSKSVSLANDDIVSALKVREQIGVKALFKVYTITLLSLFRFMWIRHCTEPPLVELGISSY